MEKIKYKDKKRLRVVVSSLEDDLLKQQARKVNLSVSSYLKKVGLGYEPKSVIDNEKIEELLKIKADLGRLGGLLKLWLTRDDLYKIISDVSIRRSLKLIDDNQLKIKEVISQVLFKKP